MRIIRGLLLLD